MKRPGAIVGVLVFAALVFVALDALRTEGPGSRGMPGGTTLPALAAPLALSDLDGDANGPTARARCAARDILNVCQLSEQGAVVLAFFIESSDRCDEQLDTLDRMREEFPDLRSPRSRSRATATSCAAGSASTAGSCRSATTAMARSPTSTASRSARRSRSPSAAARSCGPGRQPGGARARSSDAGVRMSGEPVVRQGWIAPELAEEHPGLGLAWTDVAATLRASPPELRKRLRGLADRMHGAQAIALRSREVPHAYRVFFRHVGLDPDGCARPPRRSRCGG